MWVGLVLQEMPQEWLRAPQKRRERMAARKRTGSENETAGRSETAAEDSMRSKKLLFLPLNIIFHVASSMLKRSVFPPS